MFQKKLLSTSIAVLAALGVTAVNAAEQTSGKDEKQIEEVTVVGIRASLTKALDVKREKIQIVDSIVSEDIGKFPDNNVVESLQRVTGVQVTNRGSGEISGISIRGLNDVTTTVNGRNIFTAAGTSVALQDIPASLLKRVDVYKTRSASQIESGIAGALDIQTNRPFDFDGSKFVVAARGIYGEQSGKTDPVLSGLASNRWETGAGDFGALVNLSYSDIHYRDQSVTPGAMVPFMTATGGGPFGPYERVWPTNDAVAGDIWTPGLLDGVPSAAGSTFNLNGDQVPYILGRDAIFASDFTGERKRPAANISLQFAPDDSSEYTFEAFYNGYRNQSFNSLFFSFVDWWGSYHDLTPEEAAASANVTLYPGTNIVKSRSVNDPWVFTSGDLTTAKTDSYLYALGGRWDLSDRVQLKSELVYQDSEYSSDFFAMRFIRPGNNYKINVDFNRGGGLPAFNFEDNPDTATVDESNMADPSAYITDGLYDNANRDKGDALTYTADLTVGDLGFFSSVDAGLRIDQRNATTAFSTQDACCGGGVNVGTIEGLAYINSGFFDGRAQIPTTWAVADGYYIRSHADDVRTQYGISKKDLLRNFEIKSLTTSAYVQGKFDTELAGKLLDGEIGVRYTGIDSDTRFWDTSVLVQPDPVMGNTKTSKLLPSLMLRYSLADDLFLRFNYTETLRYPNYGDLNPQVIYTPDVTNIGYGTVQGGNPELKPTESKNFDLSMEWYFAPSSSLYGTLFKRKIDGFVIGFRRPVMHDTSPTDSTPYKYILSQPYNASNGELSGAELGLVWFPENLPDALDGLGIQASYTMLNSSQDTPLTDSEGNIIGSKTTDLFGVSDNSYSVVMAYDKNDLGVRLSYTWRSAFLYDYEAALFANPLERWRKPESSMDLQVSYKVGDNLELTLDGTNLTNEIYQSYYGKDGATTNNFGSAIYSRTFALGARYSF